MMWPPSFCKKGTSNCVGPYFKRSKWVLNEGYNDKQAAVGDNVPYFNTPQDYEVGYNWDKATKFRNMMLQTRTYGYIEYFYGTSDNTDQACFREWVLIPGF
jgi:hypothetical protein